MQSGSNSLRTLKGVFDVPKMNHRRDFLRENKLNLRELQKNTTQKLTQQKVEQEKQERKHLQRYPKAQEHYVGRRSNSQQRYNGEDLRQRQPQRAAGGGVGGTNVTDGGAGGEDGGRPNRMSFRRSYSQQRESRENLQPTYPAASFDNYGNNHQTDVKDSRVPRSASVASIISKAESCDKEIQTEDIIDEDFLYDALKKCSSTEVDFRNKHLREGEHSEPTTVSRSNVSLHSQHTKYEDNKSTHSREHIQYDHHDHNLPGDNKNFHDQYTDRSEYTQTHNGHNQMVRTNQHTQEHECLGEQFQNLHINSHAARECEAQSSARSRQTMLSNVSKKKTNGNYKLGNREDVRLPRYLEKEKREKEEQRVREKSRDPNCPLGYYALAEEERLLALNTAQKKMASLIQELNHMPMTSETLRVRSRKGEIEKELQQIELDIRTFSKPKVYVVGGTSSSLQY